MNSWIGNTIFIISIIASIAIRVPHDKISQQTKVAWSRKDAREKLLLALVMIGMIFLPIASFTPLLSFAQYPLHLAAVALGTFAMVLSLWLFYRSHADLGKNWSATLEIREGHQLVTGGVYKSVRHPMYSSIFLLAIGQLLLLPNWVAGPALLFAFALMFVSRMNTEEKLMLDQFGTEYESYRRRTKRLIPGVW